MILAGMSDLPEVIELKFDHVFFTGNFFISHPLIKKKKKRSVLELFTV